MRETCCICLELHPPKYFRILTPCGHKLCEECMTVYILINVTTCPLCRSDFTLGDDENPSLITGEGNTPSGNTPRGIFQVFKNSMKRMYRFLEERFSFVGYISIQQRNILLLHDHSTHVQAARKMERNPPCCSQLKIVDLQTRRIDNSSVETILSDLMESTHNRIYNPGKFLRYFR